MRSEVHSSALLRFKPAQFARRYAVRVVYSRLPVCAAGAVYDFDTKGPKMTLTAAIMKSPVQYKAAFSNTARFPRREAPNDLTYDIDAGVWRARALRERSY